MGGEGKLGELFVVLVGGVLGSVWEGGRVCVGRKYGVGWKEG